jgi:hypothetical protein
LGVFGQESARCLQQSLEQGGTVINPSCIH